MNDVLRSEFLNLVTCCACEEDGFAHLERSVSLKSDCFDGEANSVWVIFLNE